MTLKRKENKKLMKKFNFLMLITLTLLLLAACSAKTEEKASGDKQDIDKDLIAAKEKFSVLGEVPIPDDNPMSDEKIELGKKLYFDPRLSGDNSISCMTCHLPNEGFGDGQATFTGFGGVEGTRNSPTIINSGYYQEFFWDGRASSLEEQALGPITAEVEMNQDLDELVDKLEAIPAYVEEFQTVFNSGITVENIAKALAAFQRTIVVTDTAFDRYLLGDDDAISKEAKEGMKLFVGKAGCISCHDGPKLTNHDYHNTGIEGDDGRFEVTNKEEDKGKFRTPGLRALTHTAPYMHDGSLATIEDVVNFYNVGGGNDPNKDELIKPLGLTKEEIDQLVAFLETMSGEVPEISIPTLP